jgi:hypothetical protein
MLSISPSRVVDEVTDGLVITVYARVTGGGYRGAVSIRRRDDTAPLELAFELPEIFSQPEPACAAAADFADGARATGALMRMLEAWEDARPRHMHATP